MVKNYKDSEFVTIYARLMTCAKKVERKGKEYYSCDIDAVASVLATVDRKKYGIFLKYLIQKKQTMLDCLRICEQSGTEKREKELRSDLARFDTVFQKIDKALTSKTFDTKVEAATSVTPQSATTPKRKAR